MHFTLYKGILKTQEIDNGGHQRPRVYSHNSRNRNEDYHSTHKGDKLTLHRQRNRGLKYMIPRGGSDKYMATSTSDDKTGMENP